MSFLNRIKERIDHEMGMMILPPPCEPVRLSVIDMVNITLDTFDSETEIYKTSMAFIVTVDDPVHIGHGHHRYNIRIEPRLKGMFN